MMLTCKLPVVRMMLLACLGIAGGCGSVGSMTPGNMLWVAPDSKGQPRVGTVYLMRGWVGLFSGGMDRLGREINEGGVTARVFQHDQCEELAKTMAQRYQGTKNAEPICIIGHSFGSDDAIVIARELDKVGVPVDLIVIMDAVNETVVPKNVKLCVNYWQPGMFGSSNFLRGIPLKQEPGGNGKLMNVNLLEEGRELREFMTNHVNIDEGPKIHKAILQHVLATCPQRAAWAAMHGAQPRVAQLPTGAPLTPVADEGARTAAAPIGPSNPGAK
jgi:hypothetical protein